jgi:hypothetical protein
LKYGGGAVALYNGTLKIENCAFINNRDNANIGGKSDKFDRGGGAVFVEKYGDVEIINSTFYGNETRVNGGAVHARGKIKIINSTITGNRVNEDFENWEWNNSKYQTTGLGGGLFLAPQDETDSIMVVNSIVAGNAAGDGHNDIDSGGFDEEKFAPEKFALNGGSSLLGIVGAFYSDFLSQNDTWLSGVDVSSFLKTGEPVVNVKGTPTIELLRAADSPAIDKADGGYAPEYDQRGLPRSGAPDIGAFELQGETDIPPDGSGCETGLGLVSLLVIGIARCASSLNKPRAAEEIRRMRVRDCF